MPRYITYDYKCDVEECEFGVEPIVVSFDERDEQQCPVCGGELTRMFATPLPLRNSYHMGKKRKGFEELKRAAKLETKKAGLPAHKRGEIQKEIDNLKKTKKG